jgi:hypothetical protein
MILDEMKKNSMKLTAERPGKIKLPFSLKKEAPAI